MTTFLDILLLDNSVFYDNTQCGIIAHTRDDAKIIFRSKVKFPFEHLPPQIIDKLEPKSDTANEYLFKNNSSIRVGTSMRSGTLNYLHISEYGKLCAKFPDKAVEIRTGALNTVKKGQCIAIESTAEGAHGHYFDICQKARDMERQGKILTELDYRFHFFPWYDDPDYRMTDEETASIIFTKEDDEYFAELEEELGITIDMNQRAWYVKIRETQSEFMLREYPSTPDEAFKASIEGAFYAKQMAQVRSEKRLCHVPYDSRLPVNTFWDLGLNDEMVIWFHQRSGMENWFINYYAKSDEPLTHFVKKLQEMPYVYGKHYLPHDVNVRSIELKQTRRKFLQNLGLRPIVAVDRIADEQVGIDAVRSVLPTCYFDEKNCAAGVKGLDHYRKEWNEKLATFNSTPLHDWASHPAKAFEQFAVGYRPGSRVKSRKKRTNWRTA